MMHIGVLEMRLSLGGVRSLKEKRSIVKGVLARIRHRFEVAAAEVADQNCWESAGLGFAVVGTDVGVLQGRLQKVVTFIEADGRGVVVDYQIEMVS